MPKVAILAGGFGTRLSEETTVRPKPMVEIGGMPIIWHIMKFYSHYGCSEFVVIGGYKVEMLREFFLNYRALRSDMTVNLASGEVTLDRELDEKWTVTVLDTGDSTMTGGRLRRARHLLDNDTFFLTYGDGLSDVRIDRLFQQHRESGCDATLTAVVQPGRYGSLRLSNEGERVSGFREKGRTDGGLINGGFFVCEPAVFDLIEGDDTVWEDEPMTRLVEQNKLGSFVHEGYWQSMDSLRDKQVLEEVWATSPPWKVW